MTVATLLLTSLIFLAMGWVRPLDRVTALSVAAIVCIAASNGGTTSQDLKTGQLVGATPFHQQIAILVGAVTSAIVIGWTLNMLNDASTVYSKKGFAPGLKVENVAELTKMEMIKGPESSSDSKLYHVLYLPEPPKVGPLAELQPGKYLVDDAGIIQYFVDPGINGVLKTRDNGSPVVKYEAPKARLMSLIIDGILSQKLPWALVLLGVSISLVLELCGIASLPFAVGVYLPLSTSTPVFVGGFVRYLVDRRRSKVGETAAESESSPGVLYASGLIAGGAISGIVLAILLVKEDLGKALDLGSRFPAISGTDLTSVVAFAILSAMLLRTAMKREPQARAV